MFRSLLAWLDHRTGCTGLLREALFERVPGGARWRYIWGSTLTFAFTIQVLTGIVLWAAYSPSSQTAWESVFYIQHEMWGGWLVRGIHHFTAQAMNVLLVLHLMQVVIDGAYRAPREVNFWFGVLMLTLVLALSLTGYLLPWDQKGYWATRVATNIVGVTPVLGPMLQKILIGGATYGHHTLTRFFALHAGVLPATLAILTVGHIYLFRRHGLKAREPYRKPDAYFWPDQLLRDAIASLAVMAVVLFLTVYLGAPLDAPADPSEPFSAARPEWYFLFLFQLLKYFPGRSEIIGAILLPTVIMVLVVLMPIIGRRWLGHAFNVVFVTLLLIGAARLTTLALRQDRNDPAYLRAVERADADAVRARQLAASSTGIPPSGAVSLLRLDAYTRGPRLFAQHCSSCHRVDGTDGLGQVPKDAAQASDLNGLASRAWLTGLLTPDGVDSPHYFGNTKFKDGKMVRFVKRDLKDLDDAKRRQLAVAIKALSAEATLPSQHDADLRETADIEAGREAIRSELGCTDCHEFRKADDTASAPQLTGYGSRDWLVHFISNPADPRFYGKRNDRMPAFANGVLTETEIGLIADWLRGDWYRPALATTRGSSPEP